MDRKSLEFEARFFERIVAERPNYIDALIPLAEVYTRSGEHKKGLLIDRRLSQLCKDDPVVFYNLACSYALLGQKKRAFQALRKSIRLGYRDFDHMKRDSDLKCLHAEPEYLELLAEIF